MDRIRMTGPESPYYRQAMELYAAGFSLHEQRRPEEQIQAMRDPAFHCDALVESGTFIGLLFYWEAVGVTYVEHFAVVEALRSSGAGSVPWPRSVPPTPPWYWRSIRLWTPSPPVGKAFISGWLRRKLLRTPPSALSYGIRAPPAGRHVLARGPFARGLQHLFPYALSPRHAVCPGGNQPACSNLTQGHIQHHHNKEARHNAQRAHIGVLAQMGLRDELLHHHIHHGAGGKCQQPRHHRRNTARHKNGQDAENRLDHAGEAPAEERLEASHPLLPQRQGYGGPLREVLNTDPGWPKPSPRYRGPRRLRAGPPGRN